MTRNEFNEATERSKFKFKPEHLEILFTLVKDYEYSSYRKAILKINEMDAFPKRENLFEIIKSFDVKNTLESTRNDSVFENQWYIVNRAKNVWETSFTIKKSFWVKKKMESA